MYISSVYPRHTLDGILCRSEYYAVPGPCFPALRFFGDGSPAPELAALRRMPGRRAPALALLLLRDQAQLLQGRHPVVNADLLGDQPVFDLEHGHAGELHLLAATRWQRADRDV